MTAAHEQSLASLVEATQRLIRGVDGLDDDAFAAPTALPGWSRAHLVAHLALNAEALGHVLVGIAHGTDVAMYESQAARDADIAELAAAEPAELRERFLGSTQSFLDAAVSVRPGGWAGEFRRTADAGQLLPRIAIPQMREREVEIHHADLLVGYGPTSWPEEFLDATFNLIVHDRAGGPPMLLRTPDGDVPIGDGGPVVTGSRADLTWWLLGRGEGEGLTAEPALPDLEAWR